MVWPTTLHFFQVLWTLCLRLMGFFCRRQDVLPTVAPTVALPVALVPGSIPDPDHNQQSLGHPSGIDVNIPRPLRPVLSISKTQANLPRHSIERITKSQARRKTRRENMAHSAALTPESSATNGVRPPSVRPMGQFDSVPLLPGIRTFVTRKPPPVYTRLSSRTNFDVPLRSKGTPNSSPVLRQSASASRKYPSTPTRKVSSQCAPDVIVSPSTPYGSSPLNVVALRSEVEYDLEPISTFPPAGFCGNLQYQPSEETVIAPTAHSSGPTLPPACFTAPRAFSETFVLWDAAPNPNFVVKAVALPKLTQSVEKPEPLIDNKDTPYADIFDFAMYLKRLSGEAVWLHGQLDLERNNGRLAGGGDTRSVDRVEDPIPPSGSVSSSITSSQASDDGLTLLEIIQDSGADGDSVPFGWEKDLLGVCM